MLKIFKPGSGAANRRDNEVKRSALESLNAIRIIYKTEILKIWVNIKMMRPL
jgi:hypothetical protein